MGYALRRSMTKEQFRHEQYVMLVEHISDSAQLSHLLTKHIPDPPAAFTLLHRFKFDTNTNILSLNIDDIDYDQEYQSPLTSLKRYMLLKFFRSGDAVDRDLYQKYREFLFHTFIEDEDMLMNILDWCLGVPNPTLPGSSEQEDFIETMFESLVNLGVLQ